MNFHEINEGRPNPLAPDRSDHRSFKTITATSNNTRIKTSNNSVCKIYIYYTLIHVHDTQPCPQVYFVVSWLHFYQNIKFQMFIYFIFLKKVLDSVCPETCTIQKTISQFKNTWNILAPNIHILNNLYFVVHQSLVLSENALPWSVWNPWLT